MTSRCVRKSNQAPELSPCLHHDLQPQTIGNTGDSDLKMMPLEDDPDDLGLT